MIQKVGWRRWPFLSRNTSQETPVLILDLLLSDPVTLGKTLFTDPHFLHLSARVVPPADRRCSCHCCLFLLFQQQLLGVGIQPGAEPFAETWTLCTLPL